MASRRAASAGLAACVLCSSDGTQPGVRASAATSRPALTKPSRASTGNSSATANSHGCTRGYQRRNLSQ